MKLAIDTNFWSVERLQDLPAVLAEVAVAGYFGFVLDAQWVDLARPDWLYRWATHYALNVVALQLDGAEAVERVAAYASEVLAPFVSLRDIDQNAEALNALGSVCRAAGVRLVLDCSDDTRDECGLVAQTDPVLVSFALDLGRLQHASEALLRRVGYFTMKDRAPVPELSEALRTRDTWLVVERGQA